MIKAFVYGTLRIGQYNYEWSSGDVVDEIANVTTTGDLYFVDPYGRGYPVAKLDGSGTIIGDVLVYPDDSDDWAKVYYMESHAGYELREIVVDTPAGPLGAVAWHYVHRPVGPKIEDGDWCRAAGQKILSEIS